MKGALLQHLIVLTILAWSVARPDTPEVLVDVPLAALEGSRVGAVAGVASSGEDTFKETSFRLAEHPPPLPRKVQRASIRAARLQIRRALITQHSGMQVHPPAMSWLEPLVSKLPLIRRNDAEKEFVSALVAHGVRALIFDFDKTMIVRHSGGVVPNHPAVLSKLYLAPSVVPTVNYALAAGLKLGIATFADDAAAAGAPPGSIVGTSLVRSVLATHGLDPANFSIVAYYPNLHYPENAIPEQRQFKRYHLSKLCSLFDVRNSEVMFLDDDIRNVITAINDGYAAAHVPTRGFDVSRLMIPLPNVSTKSIPRSARSSDSHPPSISAHRHV